MPRWRSFCARGRIPWREDSSNASERFARNRIRHELLPLLAREWNPGIVATLAHTADWAQAEESYWDEELDRLAAGRISEQDGAVLLHAPSLASMPTAAARRLVRRAIERAKGDLRGIDFQHVEQVLGTGVGRARPWPGGSSGPGRVPFIRVAAVRAACLGDACSAILSAGGGPRDRSAARLGSGYFLELIEKPETFEGWESVYNSGMGCLDWRRLSGPLELRSWRPGDRYQPSGSSGIEKIKTLFQRRVFLFGRGAAGRFFRAARQLFGRVGLARRLGCGEFQQQRNPTGSGIRSQVNRKLESGRQRRRLCK